MIITWLIKYLIVKSVSKKTKRVEKLIKIKLLKNLK